VDSRGPAACGEKQLGSGKLKYPSSGPVPLLKVLEGIVGDGADSLLGRGHFVSKGTKVEVGNLGWRTASGVET
jgi:hypothetical protein